ncbi:hypothetical protein K2173_021702 [Erythroxylum novogranatense]|uniref:BHLH domain-containing protein n=1 Tax=Erythroxylum novogranatense TaxID=1862640 RepID=A0AAV8TJJ0_9ROSI|nr:hypothetical protein K2173_021702 [Erythroxylum novogranatense]
MDHCSSISQVDHYNTDELFQLSAIPWQQQAVSQDKVLTVAPSGYSSDLTANRTQLISQRRKSSMVSGVDDQNPSDRKKKKIIHRDIERQRRQEMAGLYGSLRSLLPFEYLKGKRSISDQIQGAVKYLKHLEHKTRELNEKKEELRKLCNDYNIPTSSGSALESSENFERDTLTVEPCLVGVEVAINTAYTNGFPLSRALELMIGEKFTIVSCISTKVNERMIHAIKAEVTDGRKIIMLDLQQKLTDSITSYANLIFQ